MSLTAPSFSSAMPVPEERRMAFLPRLFGARLLLVGEHTVFGFMERLSPTDYTGGMWDFLELADARGGGS